MYGNQADMHSAIAAAVALATSAIASNTTTNGEIIDMQGKLALDFSILSGTLTDGTYTVALEEGDEANLSDAAAIPADRLLGALPVFTASEDDAVKRVGFFKLKRYCRLSIVSTGVTTGGTLSSIAVVNPDLTE